MPNWGYQLRLADSSDDTAVESRVRTKEQIRQFLNAVYGGKGPDGETGFCHERGPLWEVMPRLERTGLMGEGMLGFYAGEFERRGVRGSCGLPLSFFSSFLFFSFLFFSSLFFSFLFFSFLFFSFFLSFFLASLAVGTFCPVTGYDGIFLLTTTPRVGKNQYAGTAPASKTSKMSSGTPSLSLSPFPSLPFSSP